MADRLILHIGDAKTGSTSIQRTLQNETYIVGEYIASPGPANDVGLAFSLFRRGHRKYATKRWNDRSALLRESDADVGIISSEHFQFVNPKVLRDRLTESMPEHVDTVQIIAYARPHVDRLVSTYSQRVRTSNFIGSISEFYQVFQNGSTFPYSARFLSWREVFGDQFVLRPMVRSHLHEACVVHDFFHVALGHTDFEITLAPDQNASPSLEDLSIIAQLTETRGEADRAVAVHLDQLLAADPSASATKQGIDSDLVAEMIADQKEDAALLDEIFFDDTPMTDALMKAPEKAIEAPQSIKAVEHFDESEMRLMRVFTQLVADIRSQVVKG